jgi:lipid A 3-O-deacylase
MNHPGLGVKIWRYVRMGLCCLWLAGVVCPVKAAESDEQTGFFSFTEENDSLADAFGSDQDRHYTQGLKLSLFGGDDFMTNTTATLNRVIPAWGFNPVAGDLVWVILGQNIYTPNVLTNRALIKTDRPYAGWLYTGAIYQRRGPAGPNTAVLESFEVNLGLVGPDSLAGAAQRQWHRWFVHNDVPTGWGNQIHDEPGLVLKYGRTWRWSPTENTARYIDILPHVGGDLGNVFTFATAGVTGRLGYDLPSDFGVQIIDSPTAVNGGLRRDSPPAFFYLFGGADGRAVGHDVTLDGNSFRGSPSVEKNVLVGDLSWGLALQVFRHVEITYTRVIRTEEFKGQNGDDIFASVNVKAMFCF